MSGASFICTPSACDTFVRSLPARSTFKERKLCHPHRVQKNPQSFWGSFSGHGDVQHARATTALLAGTGHQLERDAELLSLASSAPADPESFSRRKRFSQFKGQKEHHPLEHAHRGRRWHSRRAHSANERTSRARSPKKAPRRLHLSRV